MRLCSSPAASRRLLERRFTQPEPTSGRASLHRYYYHVVLHSNSMSANFADNLTMNDVCTAPEVFTSWHEQAKPGQ
jgi:hypothetical protein